MESTDLQARIQLMLDGEISPEELEALEAELLSDGDARETYKNFVRLHSAMEVNFESHATIKPQSVVPVELLMARQRRRVVRISLLAAAAAVVISAFVLTLLRIPDAPLARFRTAPGALFTLSHEVADGEEAPEGQVLAAGSRLRLQRGTMEGLFKSGVRVVVEAPCDLRVLAEGRVALGEGVAWFEVPEQAVGFSVLTQELVVVDLGTAFGVYASVDEHDEVHVTKGAVEVSSRVEGGETQTLQEGEARRVDGEGELHEIAVEADRFASHLPEATPIAIANSNFEDASDPVTHGNLGTVADWTEENAASVYIDDNGRSWQPDRDRPLYLSGDAAAVNQNLNHNWSSSDTYTLGLVGFEPQFRAGGAGDAFRVQLRQADGAVLWDSGSQSLDGTVKGDPGNVSYTGSGHEFRWTIDATTFVGAGVVEGSPLNLRIACADGVAYLDDVWLDVIRHP